MPRFDAILCPVDPASPSEAALQHAIALGDWFDGEVTVVAVRPHGWHVARATLTGRRASRPADDATALERRIREVSGQAVRVQVVEGAVGREIVRAARDLEADLVVMGSRPPGRIERLLFGYGSVTEHVLAHTSCPVLIMPPGESAASPASLLFDRIVCGVDRSLESHRALAYALSLVRRSLAVVHALEDFSDEHPRFAGHFNTAACWREVQPEIQADYEGLIPEEARLWCAIDVMTPIGRAGSALVEAAVARQASLVVIGTVGGQPPFGATVRHVIHKAPCPVLAVPRAVPRAAGRARAATASGR